MSRQSVSFEVPIRTQGTQNKRDHWRKVANRSLEVRAAVQLCARGCRGLRSFKARPAVVTLVRVWRQPDQGELDQHDNLPAALKPVADELAKLLGFASDRDPDIAFTYGQERGDGPSVRVLIQGPCRARTVIYDVEPGSKPGDGSGRVEWTKNRDRSLPSLGSGVTHPLASAGRQDLYRRDVAPEDPDAHAARQLRENRGVPGSVDDEMAAAMVTEERAGRSRKGGRDG